MPYNQRKDRVMYDGKKKWDLLWSNYAVWHQRLVKHQRSIYLRQYLTKLIPDISLNSCAVGFKLQGRFLAQAN